MSQERRPTNQLRLPSVTELIKTFKIDDSLYYDTFRKAPSNNKALITGVSMGDSPRNFATPDIAKSSPPREFSNYYYSRRYSSSDAYPANYGYQNLNPAQSHELNPSSQSSPVFDTQSSILTDEKLKINLKTSLDYLLNISYSTNEIENNLRDIIIQLSAKSPLNGNKDMFHQNSPTEKHNGKEILNKSETNINLLLKNYNHAIKTVNQIKFLIKSMKMQLPNDPPMAKKKRKPIARRKSIHSISRPKQHSSPKSSKGHLKVKFNKLNFVNSVDPNNPSIPSSLRGGLNEGLCIRNETSCEQCGSKTTPEWRRGPNGSRTLCNACGLYYSKLIKKFDSKEADRIMQEKKDKGLVGDRRLL